MSVNRMNDLIEGTRHVGDALLDGEDIYTSGLNLPTCAVWSAWFFPEGRIRSRRAFSRMWFSAPGWPA